MTDYTFDGHDLSSLFNLNLPSFAFSDDVKKNVPSFGSIIYTVWDSNDEFIYVGIAGTQHTKPVKNRNPRSRMESHSSGHRSGDQFCIYIQDFFVLPKIFESGEYEPRRGYLDQLTKEYIHQNLRYRVMSFQTEDSVSIVRDLENKIKRGAFEFPPPFLNGLS